MDIERETVVEAGAAVVAVFLFIGVVVVGGSMGNSSLTTTGAYTIIGGIVLFVLVMAGFGLWLSTRE